MNFDRVADIYDLTRSIPREVEPLIVERIVEATNASAETRFLEIGVGTGRIALPIASRGYSYTGVDISEKMMDRLRAKVAGRENIRLVNADIEDLPFPDDSFDVVIAVHILHLVPDWRKALAEARRVTVPGAYFVHAGNRHVDGAPGIEIRQQWGRFVEEAGAKLPTRGASLEAVVENLTEQGCYMAEYLAAQWVEELRPIELIEQLNRRTFSATWNVPEDALQSAHEQLLAWGKEHYGDLEQPVPSPAEFIVSVSSWPG